MSLSVFEPTLAKSWERVFICSLSGLRLVQVDSSSPATTILVANALLNAEFLSPTQAQLMVKKLLQRVQ